MIEGFRGPVLTSCRFSRRLPIHYSAADSLADSEWWLKMLTWTYGNLNITSIDTIKIAYKSWNQINQKLMIWRLDSYQLPIQMSIQMPVADSECDLKTFVWTKM